MSDELTERMQEIRARLEAATPGLRFEILGVARGDAALVAHAPADLAYLLDGLLLMQAKVAKLQRHIEHLEGPRVPRYDWEDGIGRGEG